MTSFTVTAEGARVLGFRTTVLLATACGLGVGNSYYAQPLIAPISQSLDLAPQLSGLIVSVIQVGYVAGLIFIVPLGDLVENRRLVTLLLATAGLALLGLTLAPSVPSFLAAGLAVGAASAGTQVIIALVGRLAPDDARGRLIGYITSGVFLGILLARPSASLLAYYFGWHAAFLVPSILIAGIAVAVGFSLPECHPPSSSFDYAGILQSLVPLVRDTPILRRRAAYHAAIFGVFSLYWTGVPLLLASPAFGLTQRGIGIFALAGASGAAVAPLAGRAGDRGWTSPATGLAMVTVVLAIALSWYGAASRSIGLLFAAAVLIDIALSINLVLSQRELLALRSAASNRLNGLFRLIFFGSGALASALAGLAYTAGGWTSVCAIQLGFIAGGTWIYLTTAWPWSFVARRLAERRAAAELAQMSDHDRKDLGYPAEVAIKTWEPK